MAENKQFYIGGINVVTQPHSPQRYVELMRALFRLKRPVPVRGTQHLMIGELKPIRQQEWLDGMIGRLYRFDQIDPKAPWFNVENNEVATAEEISEIKIPPRLKPNLKMFDFVFYPKGHKLYFQTRHAGETLGPQSLKRILDRLCELPQIAKAFGDVEITVIPEKEQLDRILGLHRLAKLVIDVKRPNPDDLEDDEDRVFKRLDKMGTRRMLEILTAEPGESIKPDASVQLMARVAANNGRVVGIGYTDAGLRVEESTVDKPWQGIVIFDPELQPAREALIEATNRKHGKD